MVDVEDLKFIDEYVKWLKKTPNRVWSKIQKKFIDALLKRKRDKRIEKIIKEMYLENVRAKIKITK